jgi:protocatechuate 3,4-dioxygenase alpha subunit
VGRVIDGDGKAITDAMVEICQPDGDGHYPTSARRRRGHCGFRGFGRIGTGTDAQSRFVFQTVKPGAATGRPKRPSSVSS